MPKIIDPDNLTTGTSVFWATGSVATRTIGISSSLDSAGSLVPPLESGSDSGVTFQTLYSFAKEEWKTSDSLIRIPFPFVSITKNQFDIINFWDFNDDSTRYLVRDAGWSVSSGSVTTQEWVGIRTLGTLGFDADTNSGDQVYFVQSGSTAGNPSAGFSLVNSIQNFKMSGSVNQAIQHYSASSTTVDRNFRGETTLYVREYQKIYDDANIQSDLGVTDQEYTLLSVPLQNSVDLKITTEVEASASTNSPWKEVDIYFLSGSGFESFDDAPATVVASYVVSGSDTQYYITNNGGTKGTVAPPGVTNGTATFVPYAHESTVGTYLASGSQQIDISGDYNAFNVIITNGTGSSATTGSIEDVYTSVQYQLRQNADIDKCDHFTAGTFIGKRTRLLLSFVGDTLVTSDGVFVDNQQDADTNSIDFFDVSGSVVRYPFVSTGIISFNQNLLDDVSGSFFMFFTNLTPEGGTGSFGSSSAILVEDQDSNPITGSTFGDTDGYSFTFDYDGNVQGDRDPPQPAEVTVVAIGFDTAAYVTVTSTLGRNKANNISLVSSLERNYDNPA